MKLLAKCRLCGVRRTTRWDNYEQAYLCATHRDEAAASRKRRTLRRLFADDPRDGYEESGPPNGNGGGYWDKHPA